MNPERTGAREGPLAYSAWHRSLGPGYNFMDLDALEYRDGRGVVAVMELIRCRAGVCPTNPKGKLNQAFWLAAWGRSEFKREVVTRVAEALGVPGYFVAHDADLSAFWVKRIAPVEGERLELSREAYGYFIRAL